MLTQKNMVETFENGTIISLGRRKIRTATESANQKGVSAEDLPGESYPHTFLDVSGMKLEKVLREGGTGYVVTEQKLFREQLTDNQAARYRAGIREKYPALAAKYDEPIHVIVAATAGSAVALTREDKLEEIRDQAPAIWNAMFENKTPEERLEIVDPVWNQLSVLADK